MDAGLDQIEDVQPLQGSLANEEAMRKKGGNLLILKGLNGGRGSWESFIERDKRAGERGGSERAG